MGFERMGLQCLYRPVLLATIRMRRDFDVVRGFGVVRFRLPTPQLPAAVLTANRGPCFDSRGHGLSAWGVGW